MCGSNLKRSCLENKNEFCAFVSLFPLSAIICKSVCSLGQCSFLQECLIPTEKLLLSLKT